MLTRKPQHYVPLIVLSRLRVEAVDEISHQRVFAVQVRLTAFPSGVWFSDSARSTRCEISES